MNVHEFMKRLGGVGLGTGNSHLDFGVICILIWIQNVTTVLQFFLKQNSKAIPRLLSLSRPTAQVF